MAEAHRTTPEKYVPGPCPTCGSTHAIISGAWLRWAREREGLSLKAMATRLGFSSAYLCDVEYGRRHGSPEIRSAYEALS